MHQTGLETDSGAVPDAVESGMPDPRKLSGESLFAGRPASDILPSSVRVALGQASGPSAVTRSGVTPVTALADRKKYRGGSKVPIPAQHDSQST